MNKMVIWILLGWTTTLWAGHGIIQTLDGRELEGEIRLENGGIVISSTNQMTTNISWASLSLLRLQPPPPAGVPSPTGRVDGSRGTNSNQPKLPAGVLLTSGSFIARMISSADESAV